MKTIARLAAAVAIVATAALVGPGCRNSDPPRASPGDPPQAPPSARPVEPAPSPAPATSAVPAPAPAPAGSAGSAGPAAPASKDYAGDIAKLCEVVQLSGAEAESPDDRRLPIANWLAANLTTTESRQFLAQIQPLVGDRKADALDAEARRVGLAACSLAAEWRAAPR